MKLVEAQQGQKLSATKTLRSLNLSSANNEIFATVKFRKVFFEKKLKKTK